MHYTPAATRGGATGETATAFGRLADETGVSSIELQDVFLLGEDGAIDILPPGRKLGTSVADRARTVTILLAGARHVLLRSRTPVEEIRRVCIDRGCYDSKNFKTKHLGNFDAINLRTEEVLVNASKWLPAFVAAVKTARGESAE